MRSAWSVLGSSFFTRRRPGAAPDHDAHCRPRRRRPLRAGIVIQAAAAGSGKEPGFGVARREAHSLNREDYFPPDSIAESTVDAKISWPAGPRWTLSVQ